MNHATALAPPPQGLSLEVVRMKRIRGPNVGLPRRWFLKREGEAGWQAFLSGLSPECRRAFSQPLGIYEWVDAALYTEVSRAFVGYAKDHDPYRAGEVAAREELTTLNRWILRVLSPTFLLSNVPRIWAFYMDGGAVHLERLEAGCCELSVYAEGFVEAFFHPGLSGWIHAALTLTGVEGLRVHYTPPGSGSAGLDACRHHFELTWEGEA